MEKSQVNKKDLIILDFDNTIYHNPSNNFTININFNNIVPANNFFSELAFQVPLFSAYNFAHTQFLLLTGRPTRQKDIILELLSMKGYKIDLSVFSTYKYSIPKINSKYRESSFLIDYWTKKVEYIDNLHRSNMFNSITVINDDEVICTIIQAEIQHYGHLRPIGYRVDGMDWENIEDFTSIRSAMEQLRKEMDLVMQTS